MVGSLKWEPDMTVLCCPFNEMAARPETRLPNQPQIAVENSQIRDR
jgi:hypothetical protein